MRNTRTVQPSVLQAPEDVHPIAAELGWYQPPDQSGGELWIYGTKPNEISLS